MHEQLATAIGNVIGATLRRQPSGRVHGGSINDCFRWESDAGPIFVKVAARASPAMFESEAAGLAELERAEAVRVPRVLGVGSGAGVAWLALEWIDMGPYARATDSLLGERLALQHHRTQPSFGWNRDNTIGSTPQPNGECADWVSFFRNRRLRLQLDLAAANGFRGHLQRRGEALLERMSGLFATHQPVASLLHGDLWSGNRAADGQGQPVIFDPAVYYGDREADLAMTRLFGGFGPEFYSAYAGSWALDSGAGARVALYNLYHVLNHLNLFGAGYLGQAVALLDSLLAELG